MKPKNMTSDDLARMVQEGFGETHGRMDKQFAEVHRDLKAIRKELLGVVYRPECDDLQDRVRDLENLLTVFKKKAA